MAVWYAKELSDSVSRILIGIIFVIIQWYSSVKWVLVIADPKAKLGKPQHCLDTRQSSNGKGWMPPNMVNKVERNLTMDNREYLRKIMNVIKESESLPRDVKFELLEFNTIRGNSQKGYALYLSNPCEEHLTIYGYKTSLWSFEFYSKSRKTLFKINSEEYKCSYRGRGVFKHHPQKEGNPCKTYYMGSPRPQGKVTSHVSIPWA